MFPDSAPVLPVGENILLAEKNLRVRVQGFKPQWDDDRKLWYVDVELQPSSAYYTFVRFGLCRYQPDSLPDLEISKVVRAEFSQLLADRTATLSYGVNVINVSLSGPSALSKLGHRWNGDFSGDDFQFFPLAAKTPPASNKAKTNINPNEGANAAVPTDQLPPIVTLPPPVFSNPEAGSGHMVVAQVEWRAKGLSGDLGWEPLDGGVRLASHTSFFSSDMVTWKGVVRWPRRGTPSNRQYRLVLREFEIFQTDSDVAESLPVNNPTGVPIRSRLVYVDIFPLADPLPVQGP